MSRPTLSVVMPNYNHGHYLEQAIREIAGQSRPPDEFLVLDDASTDDSWTLLQQLVEQFPCIRLLRNERNLGVNASNNRLFAEATGDYLYAAAVDDRRLPGFFASAMEMAAAYPQAGLVFGKQEIRNDAGDYLGVLDVRAWPTAVYADPERFRREYLDGELSTHAASVATIYRREPFLEVGGYREELGSWADAFAARAIGLKYGACYVPEPFAVHVRLAGSYSDQSKQAPRRTLEMVERAARLMRSPEFRDRFPEPWVHRWRRDFRRLAIWQYWLGTDYAPDGRRPSFLARNLARLPRTWTSLRLLAHRGE